MAHTVQSQSLLSLDVCSKAFNRKFNHLYVPKETKRSWHTSRKWWFIPQGNVSLVYPGPSCDRATHMKQCLLPRVPPGRYSLHHV